MAEAINPQRAANNPNGTGNTPQGQPQGQPSSQQPQEPAWLSAIPAEHREEARKGYLLQSDYTKKSQEISERQKAWDTERADLQKRVDEYNSFAQQYQPFYQRLQANWDRIGPILEGREQVQQQDFQMRRGEAGKYEYDQRALEVAEQGVWDAVGQTHLQHLVLPLLQAQEQRLNQALAQREQYYANYLNILTDAFERGRRDPNLDLPEYMRKAISIQYGKENPLELAYSAVTSERTRRQIEEDAYARGKQDAALELQNTQHASGALQSQSIPIFRQKPMSRDQVSEAARQKAIDKGLSW